MNDYSNGGRPSRLQMLRWRLFEHPLLRIAAWLGRRLPRQFPYWAPRTIYLVPGQSLREAVGRASINTTILVAPGPKHQALLYETDQVVI